MTTPSQAGLEWMIVNAYTLVLAVLLLPGQLAGSLERRAGDCSGSVQACGCVR